MLQCNAINVKGFHRRRSPVWFVRLSTILHIRYFQLRKLQSPVQTWDTKNYALHWSVFIFLNSNRDVMQSTFI